MNPSEYKKLTEKSLTNWRYWVEAYMEEGKPAQWKNQEVWELLNHISLLQEEVNTLTVAHQFDVEQLEGMAAHHRQETDQLRNQIKQLQEKLREAGYVES